MDGYEAVPTENGTMCMASDGKREKEEEGRGRGREDEKEEMGKGGRKDS